MKPGGCELAGKTMRWPYWSAGTVVASRHLALSTHTAQPPCMMRQQALTRVPTGEKMRRGRTGPDGSVRCRSPGSSTVVCCSNCELESRRARLRAPALPQW